MPRIGVIDRAIKRGFMMKLARDVRGNTLAIMAATLIPLAGLVGGGIDISRLYITKTRMQHACDAGALAGRKSMGGGIWGTDDNAVAQQFFTANYSAGGYGATGVTSSYTESAGRVSGVSTATLPMTLMRVLGKTSELLTVNCDAEMRLPNTDVMFVLDTTGSMANKAVSSDTLTKMDSLKLAVKCFYETVARLDTDATCDAGVPSGGTGNQVQIRFGFVPYSTNVNVGKLLPTSYFANSWNYQSRIRNGDDWGPWTGDRYTYPNNNGNCTAAAANTAARQWRVTKSNYPGYGNLCYYEYRDWLPRWDYRQMSVDISALKNGTSWNNSFTRAINNDGSNRTIDWDGCIEERSTARTTDYDPIPSSAKDMDIDLLPNSSDATTLWGPALPDLIFARQVTTDWNQLDASNVTSTTNFYNSVPYYCPTEARLMQTWPSATTFQTYVNSLNPTGNTHHDIGMIWGARLLSPTGIFAATNALTPGGAEIERHLIFMTDGDTQTSVNGYAAYGMPWFDRRQTAAGSAPTDAQTDEQVDLRLPALCTAVKNKNITLWVVSFGTLAADTNTRLQACATPGRYFSATDSAALQASFRSIADQISAPRLTR